MHRHMHGSPNWPIINGSQQLGKMKKILVAVEIKLWRTWKD